MNYILAVSFFDCIISAGIVGLICLVVGFVWGGVLINERQKEKNIDIIKLDKKSKKLSKQVEDKEKILKNLSEQIKEGEEKNKEISNHFRKEIEWSSSNEKEKDKIIKPHRDRANKYIAEIEALYRELNALKKQVKKSEQTAKNQSVEIKKITEEKRVAEEKQKEIDSYVDDFWGTKGKPKINTDFRNKYQNKERIKDDDTNDDIPFGNEDDDDLSW